MLVFDVFHCFVEKGISHISGLIVFKVLSWRANLYAGPVGITFYCSLQGHFRLYIYGLKRNIKFKCHKSSEFKSQRSIQMVYLVYAIFAIHTIEKCKCIGNTWPINTNPFFYSLV